MPAPCPLCSSCRSYPRRWQARRITAAWRASWSGWMRRITWTKRPRRRSTTITTTGGRSRLSPFPDAGLRGSAGPGAASCQRPRLWLRPARRWSPWGGSRASRWRATTSSTPTILSCCRGSMTSSPAPRWWNTWPTPAPCWTASGPGSNPAACWSCRPSGCWGRALQDLALSPDPTHIVFFAEASFRALGLAGGQRSSFPCRCGRLHQTLSRAFPFAAELGMLVLITLERMPLSSCRFPISPLQDARHLQLAAQGLLTPRRTNAPQICLTASAAWRCCR